MTRTAAKSPAPKKPGRAASKTGHTHRMATNEEAARINQAIEEESRPENIAANRAYVRKAQAARAAGETLAIQVLDLLLQERHRQQLTLSELGKRCGISSANLSKLWNLDEPNVTLATVQRIAAAMNVTVRVSIEKH